MDTRKGKNDRNQEFAGRYRLLTAFPEPVWHMIKHSKPRNIRETACDQPKGQLLNHKPGLPMSCSPSGKQLGHGRNLSVFDTVPIVRLYFHQPL